MQVNFQHRIFDEKKIENAIQSERLKRYDRHRLGNFQLKIEIYLWNCELCEAFYFPLKMAEISLRNTMQKALRIKFKNPWYHDASFRTILDTRHRQNLDHAIQNEKNQHKQKISDDHIVSSLSFGFWHHLMTKRFNRTIWKNGINYQFPAAQNHNKSLESIRNLAYKIMQFRNRIAHYGAIYDKDPLKIHSEIIEFIECICPETAKWGEAKSTVASIFNQGPQYFNFTERYK